MGLKLEKVLVLRIIIVASCWTFSTLAHESSSYNEKETFSQGARVNETQEEDAEIGQQYSFHELQLRDHFRFLTGFRGGGRIVRRLGGSGGEGEGGGRGSGGGGGMSGSGGGKGGVGGGGGTSRSGGGKGGVGGKGSEGKGTNTVSAAVAGGAVGVAATGSDGGARRSGALKALVLTLFLPVTSLIAVTSIHLILLP